MYAQLTRKYASILIGGLGLILSGCGSSSDLPVLNQARGIVTYKGKPLPDAMVSFIPESGPVATAITNAEGNFTLRTRGDDGVVSGNHRVTISAFEQPKSTEKASSDTAEEGAKFVSKIPEKYGMPATSSLTASVSSDPEENQFQFDLK